MRDAAPLIYIKPRTGMRLLDFAELTQYRDLFYFLVIRDIKVKYKQTVLGGLWAIIQPLFSMVVFTLFFGELARMPSDGIPYPLFNFTAMVAWTFFANSLAGSGNSLVGNTNLLTKVYFPRIIIPLAPVLAGLLDFLIAFAILIMMIFGYGVELTFKLLYVPLLVILMVMTASGMGALLAALNAKYRDIRYMIPFTVQLWMFASPIVYPTSLVPEKYHLLYALNPMTGVIEGFRSSLLGTGAFPTMLVAVSAAVSVVLLGIGLAYFGRTERYLADVI